MTAATEALARRLTPDGRLHYPVVQRYRAFIAVLDRSAPARLPIRRVRAPRSLGDRVGSGHRADGRSAVRRHRGCPHALVDPLPRHHLCPRPRHRQAGYAPRPRPWTGRVACLGGAPTIGPREYCRQGVRQPPRPGPRPAAISDVDCGQPESIHRRDGTRGPWTSSRASTLPSTLRHSFPSSALDARPRCAATAGRIGRPGQGAV